METLSDNDLYHLIKKDNMQAFNALFNRYWKALLVYAYNILNDQLLSEDVVQDIFIGIWENRRSRTIHEMKAYLFKAVKIRSLNVLRNKKISARHITLFNSLSRTSDQYDQNISYTEISDKVNSCVSKLPDRCEEIFRLSRFENLSHQQIAEKLNISIQTVKNQITKALSLLRYELNDVIMN